MFAGGGPPPWGGSRDRSPGARRRGGGGGCGVPQHTHVKIITATSHLSWGIVFQFFLVRAVKQPDF